MSLDSPERSASWTGTPASVRIVEAIARLDDVDPMDLEPGLDEVIDTDALDYLLRHDGGPFTLKFSYGTHHVLVTDESIHIDGTVSLSHS